LSTGDQLLTSNPEQDSAWSILVVEDDEGLAALICRALTADGFSTTSVQSGEEAILAFSKSDSKQILVLDYQLSDMQADAVISKLRDDGYTPPFIVITGRGDESTAVKMMKLGARDYLVKGTAMLETLGPLVKRVTRELDMEETLRQTQDRFNRAITNAPSPMMIHAEDGEVLLINDVWTELTGYSKEEIPTISDWTEKAYGQRMAIVQEDIEEAFGLKGRKRWGDYIVTTASGEQRQWSFNSAPLGRLPDGRRLALSMAQDVTDRNRAIARVEDEKSMRAALLDNIPDCVAMIIKKTTREIVASNKAAHDMGAIPGKTCFAMCADNDDTCSFCLAPKLWTSDEPQRLEVEHRGVWYEGIWAPVSDDLYVHYIYNIDKRKRMEKHEKELQEKVIAGERRESLGVLAGGVAHDLNNILGPIILLPEMIDEVLENPGGASAEDIAEAREDLEIIGSSAERAAGMIKDLKALGQRGHIDLQMLDVNLFVKDCLQSPEIAVLLKGSPHVRIDSKLGHEGLTIAGDKIDLHRVLLNLLINALEAIPARGRVRVEVEPFSLTEKKIGYEAKELGDYVAIHVRDTGEGIPDGVLKKMFEPFVSTKKRTAGRSGSGLGLSVVHAIMQDYKGYVDVKRSSGKWSTTFSLYLPAVSENLRLDESDPGDRLPPTGTEHILIVDDELGQRHIARRSLQKLGYKVAEAEHGQAAVKLFEQRDEDENMSQESAFDLVLLDMIMESGFDGLDTYGAILKLCPDQKVIISSGQAENARIQAAEKLGAGWLVKPYDSKTLAEVVRKKLDEKS
jgi:PAS domain S-box-containing protein